MFSFFQRENVTFNYAYTGNYSLLITSKPYALHNLYNISLKTEYKKSLLIDKKPNINPKIINWSRYTNLRLDTYL